MEEQTFEQYLRQELQDGKIDFRIRATKCDDGVVTFYIHPLDKNGDTKNYRVDGDILISI